ncbi:PID-CTERM protein-sorting domain-containing protein [Winogradskyella sp. UBA3174]|uniref:PID-CTERM protein-sorting domain-containing protein n=1 Tax=Winogradskyella sp. UBA3174 TaxID=1947785 RepID=UPI0025D7C6C5|nr:hypothetical protein [Winogradskyella sp. UBA3174]|tara:strand:+ start:1529 stop:1738 length:210 start_codon:yes stop_codon:yes gene_type:complete
MKSSKNTFFKVISTMVVVFAMVCTTNLNAQQGPPGGATDTQDAIPLDGGLIALVIGAAAFGVKKLRDKK